MYLEIRDCNCCDDCEINYCRTPDRPYLIEIRSFSLGFLKYPTIFDYRYWTQIMMGKKQTFISEFILKGLPIQPECQHLFYALYLITVLGNILIIILILLTPTYM
jgi:hypothetical protein